MPILVFLSVACCLLAGIVHAQPGTLDTSFDPGAGPNSVTNSIAVQPDGKILIGGAFTQYAGIARNRIARLNSNGSLDESFDPGTGANNEIKAILIQPDGKILIAGWFTTYNGTNRGRVARLNTDGSLDTSFDPGTGTNGVINAMVLQPDGRILIAGGFSQFNGIPRNNIARLNTDGSFHADFSSSGTNSANCIALQSNGGILVGCNAEFGGWYARLLPDGTWDPNGPLTGGQGTVVAIALFSDGSTVMAGGQFQANSLNRQDPQNLVHVPTFHPSSAASISGIALQDDEKIILVGGFLSILTYPPQGGAGVPSSRSRIARLHSNGQVDTSFDPGTGANSTITSVAIQPDGQILIGGSFTSYNGVTRNRLARVNATNGAAQLQCRVFLEGPYDPTTGLMRDDLRSAGLIPTTEPYSSSGYNFSFGGGEVTTPAVLAVTGPNAIVDWVVLEFREGGDPSTVLFSRAALVQRDGDVVDVDGTSPVAMLAGGYQGDYDGFIAVRHRNHLGVMTSQVIDFQAGPVNLDFSNPTTTTYGNSARKSIPGSFPAEALWSGDVTFEGGVKYVGEGNDRDPILIDIGGSVPTNTISGYRDTDVNMDGAVKYTGADNDRDPILVNIGGSTPTNVRVEQLP